jgi:hypothetical protein
MSETARRDEYARACVRRLIEDLTDRQGFDHAWGATDDDVRNEIIETWVEIVKDSLS